jgi:FkbM family methyltransferase
LARLARVSSWWRSEVTPSLRAGVRALALRGGLDVRPFHPSSGPSARRAWVLAADHIDLVLDVGANSGHYARLLRAAGYRGAIVSFEPLSGSYERLAARAQDDPLWTCHKLALGDEAKRAAINVAGNSLSSSLLEMTELHEAHAPGSAPVATETITMTRLDDIADELPAARDRAFLKLDVQGYELAALRGAEDTLEQLRAVEVELSLVELYRGQPLFGEVFDHLTDRGFRCVGLDPVFVDRQTGYLLQVDGLFVREPGAERGSVREGASRTRPLRR